MNREQSMRGSRKYAYLVLSLVLICGTSGCITTYGQSSGDMKSELQKSYLYTSMKRFYPEGVPSDSAQIYPDLHGARLIPIEEEVRELTKFIKATHEAKRSTILKFLKPLSHDTVKPVIHVSNSGRPDAFSSPTGEITIDVRVLQAIFRGTLLYPDAMKSGMEFLLGQNINPPYDPERETTQQRNEIQGLADSVKEIDEMPGNFFLASDFWDVFIRDGFTGESISKSPFSTALKVKAKYDNLQLVYAGAILFLVAHEYGHIVLGHYAEYKKLLEDYPPDSRDENSPYCSRRRQFELDADAYALLLMSPYVGEGPKLLTSGIGKQGGFERSLKVEQLGTGETLELNTDDLKEMQIGDGYKSFFQYGYELSGLPGAATCNYPSLAERSQLLESLSQKLLENADSKYKKKLLRKAIKINE
jgi:hypothetical protein